MTVRPTNINSDGVPNNGDVDDQEIVRLFLAAKLPPEELSLAEVLAEDYTRTARAKGLPPFRVRYAHGARNALLPLVTRFGLRLAFMITGALVVERIYAYPGLGTLLFNAIQARDLPVIQGVVLISSLMVLAVILALEFVYRIIDPRIDHARAF